MCGKGSKPRPMQISWKQWDLNYKRIFKRNKKQRISKHAK